MCRCPLPTLVLATVLAAGCAQIGLAPHPVDDAAVREDPGRREPARVVVRHVLIAHEGAELPGVTRTVTEAEALAGEVLSRARGGAAFEELVRLYSDDRHPHGVYHVVNFGAPLQEPEDVERTALVRGFGDVAFSLEVGEIALVGYHASRSPFGYHVVQRLQ